MKIGFTDFFAWSLSERLAQFYEKLRWPSWRAEITQLSGDDCFSYYPFLWTKEGSVTRSRRERVAVQAEFALRADLVRQFNCQDP